MRARLLLPALLVLLLVAGTIVAALTAGRAAEREATDRAERAEESAAYEQRTGLRVTTTEAGPCWASCRVRSVEVESEDAHCWCPPPARHGRGPWS